MKARAALRHYLDTDGPILAQFLESGMGSAIGMPGLWGPARWQTFLSDCQYCQTIVFERGVNRVVAGFVGIRDVDTVASCANLVFWCVSPRVDQTLPDSSVVDEILVWCFDKLGLNKVQTEVIDGNSILPILEDSGFMVEGTRAKQYAVGDSIKDATVCAVLAQSRKQK